MAWPFAHVPDHVDGRCTDCRARTWVVLVNDHGTTAEPAPSTPWPLCWPCLRADGDPLARLR